MKLKDFDFELPTELIALRPQKPRTSAKLLVANEKSINDYFVNDLVHLLRPGDRLVLNNTKVIPARLLGTRTRKIDLTSVAEAKINVNLIERKASDTWIALVKPLRKLNLGESLDFGSGLKAQLIDKQNGTAKFLFNKKGQELEESLSVVGSMPLPPYIANKRPVDVRDDVDYQTIWAEEVRVSSGSNGVTTF
jgi:S-adenosylmethionine:tRNA ribosyltransferase-isomerase